MVPGSETTSMDIGVTIVDNRSSIYSPKHHHIARLSKLATPSNTDSERECVTPDDFTYNVVCSPLEATIEPSSLHECPVHSEPELTATNKARTESITTLTPTTNPTSSNGSLVVAIVPPTSKIVHMMPLLSKGSSKQAFWEKLFCIRSPTPSTTAVTPISVIEPAFRAPTIPSSDYIDVEALISLVDNTPLDTPSEGILVTSDAASSSTIPKFRKCNPICFYFYFLHISIIYWFSFCICKYIPVKK